MDQFNINLKQFLSDCLEDSLINLYNSHGEYSKYVNEKENIENKIKNVLNNDQILAFDDYLELLLKINSIKSNYLYLQGFKDFLRFYKTIYSLTSESEEFSKVFL